MFIGLLDFTPFIELTNDPILRMILVALGLTMAAIVAQTSRRALELEELRRVIGVSKTELIGDTELDNHLRNSVSHAKKFILDTTITSRRVVSSFDRTYNPNSYSPIVTDKVQRNEISYRLVVVIHTRERLEKAITALLMHEGKDYLIRYYNASPDAMPVLNMLSIDNEVFYLGAFTTTDVSTEKKNIFIKDPNFSELLDTYWSHLWFNAKPLNEGRKIDWNEVKLLSQRVGVTEAEVDALIQNWRNSRKQPKRRP